MSERDSQNPYGQGSYGQNDRDQQFGSGNRPSGQSHQWQSDGGHQQGGLWQGEGGQRGGSDDYSSDYRFSGQGNSRADTQGYGRGDSQYYGQGQRASGGNRSQLNDDSLRSDQRAASRNYEQARGGYGQHNDRGQQDWQRDDRQGRYGQRDYSSDYAPRNYDASGGNDFGNFTSEDYGGRDFSNRSGGAMGGMRSSESYRPSYGLSSWLHGDDDRNGRSGQSNRLTSNRGREDYGSWREYGESRGFLQRAGDEVASWFGDEEASRRREQDHRQNGQHGQAGSHRGRGPSDYTRSDERIREDANDHLTHDHHVDASHITVSVKDGELTLNGTVDHRDAKRRAEDCVEHISGVKHVQNNLRVQDRNSTTNQAGMGGSSYATSGSSNYSASTTSGSGLIGTGTSETTGTTLGGTSGASTTGGIGSSSAAGGSTSTAPKSGDKTS